MGQGIRPQTQFQQHIHVLPRISLATLPEEVVLGLIGLGFFALIGLMFILSLLPGFTPAVVTDQPTAIAVPAPPQLMTELPISFSPLGGWDAD
ncbi:MAG: hypothetical protein M3Q81_00665 [bacterium]|nr:hypothetical protein [bacterium]